MIKSAIGGNFHTLALHAFCFFCRSDACSKQRSEKAEATCLTTAEAGADLVEARTRMVDRRVNNQ
jgi:hypothetical protein